MLSGAHEMRVAMAYNMHIARNAKLAILDICATCCLVGKNCDKSHLL